MLSNSHSSKILSKGYSPINQFARLQLQEQEKTRYAETSRKIKQKLKSINQLALSDQTFLPNSAVHTKFLYSLQYEQNFEQQINNQQQKSYQARQAMSLSIQESLKQLDQLSLDGITRQLPFITNKKTVSDATRFTTQQDLLEVDQDPQYCFDCDNLILIQPHKCANALNTLQKINSRLLSIKKMANHHSISRFNLLIYYISKNQDLESLESYKSSLNALQSVDSQNPQQIIRMRLVNILEKKITILLK